MEIKTFSFMIVVLMVGSTFAYAEVDDKSLAREMASESGFSFYPTAMSLVDIGSNPVASSLSGNSFSRGCNKNTLWILDPTCSEKNIDLSLPLGRYAALELAPGTSGYAMLFHRIPYGDLQVRYMGYVYAGHRYRLSLCADSTGSHELWYRTGWQDSNRVKMDVFGRR
jgi:hypothetical protein